MDDREPVAGRQPSWWLYHGNGRVLDPAERDRRWPAPPRWRAFHGGPDEPPPPLEDPDSERRLGVPVVSDRVDEPAVDFVNAALYLRRPLLVTGPPGAGRSRLAYRIARELRLGRVLRWPITLRTTLRSGLYDYDPAGPHQPGTADPPDGHVHLGALGTALLPYRLPRVLLIDELDQSDIDLPYQLPTVFQEGGFEIRELARISARKPQAVVHTADPGRTATIRAGRVRCHEVPLVVITGSDERDLPAALRRQCLCLRLPEPDETSLTELVAAQFPSGADGDQEVLRAFLDRSERVDGLLPGQLLDAIHLRSVGGFTGADPVRWERLAEALWRPVSPAGP